MGKFLMSVQNFHRFEPRNILSPLLHALKRVHAYAYILLTIEQDLRCQMNRL